jgi:hypothetical protein
MENIQFKHDNPGWIGPGEPSWRYLLLNQPRKIFRGILQGRMSEAKHSAVATIANLWNFHLVNRFRRKVECLGCSWIGPSFLAAANWRATTFQSICPNCGCRSRHRGLTKILPDVLKNKPEGSILFFAPELVILNVLASLTAVNLITTDLKSIDVDFPGEDIQKLSFPDNTFAMIICNHVLEHVPDDQSALSECARVLMPGGIALFTIPGDFYKASTCYYDKFEAGGHYRHYGMDVTNKMRKAFPNVTAIDMGETATKRWGIRKGDFAFICIK